MESISLESIPVFLWGYFFLFAQQKHEAPYFIASMNFKI